MDNDRDLDQATAIVVPKRPFGGTGALVSKLCLGGSSVVGTNSQVLLDEALRCGIDCWEFNPFCGRKFGAYFEQHPGVRERVFLTAKARAATPAILQHDLDAALADNETGYIDFFAIHGIEDPAVLTDDVRAWAERAKGEGKIRFFGFCTHKRMDSCLSRASALDWIDGVQTFYNYRLLSTQSMQDALRRCHEQGIGIFAVKSMGLCVENEGKLKGGALSRDRLNALLVSRGGSFEQAKLRAVWQSPAVTSVCSLMPSQEILRANAVAAADEHPLDPAVVDALAEYAEATGEYFCRRCGNCDSATPNRIPIFNAMESLMYARSYRARDLATKIFAQIPASLRSQMSQSDYSEAERLCPQKMPIGRLMREAFEELSGL